MARNSIIKANSNGRPPVADLALDTSLFVPGDRVCVAVSGGADSTALLRSLLMRRNALGIVLSVLHVEHGVRGDAAGRDASFVAALAKEFDLPCEVVSVDTPERAAEYKESIEEAARHLRYQVFREVLAAGRSGKIATAHTLDDQAETVLMKLLRGAWTEGLSGIYPVLRLEDADGRSHGSCGCVIRPFLAVRRKQIEDYLESLGQAWCEDETNRSLLYTRNRIRHELLPVLREYNPQIEPMLAHLAANARAEELHWQTELARRMPQILLPGKPVRGGGRSVANRAGPLAVAIEVARLQALDPGLRRRLVRAAAEQCGATLDFDATERVLAIVMSKVTHASRHGNYPRLELPGGVCVERSARELRFEASLKPKVDSSLEPAGRSGQSGNALSGDAPTPTPEYSLPIPGFVEASAFGATYVAKIAENTGTGPGVPLPPACVRAWQPGDRVTLRYSRGPKKVKEVLERRGIRGRERSLWPVVAWGGRIIWMRGVELEEGDGLVEIREIRP